MTNWYSCEEYVFFISAPVNLRFKIYLFFKSYTITRGFEGGDVEFESSTIGGAIEL